MDKNELGKLLKMVDSQNDTDALLALRAVQGMFKAEGVSLFDTLTYAADHVADIKKTASAPPEAAAAAAGPAPVQVSGMPQCRKSQHGFIEIIQPGQQSGLEVQLSPGAVDDADMIALNLKDALVAAVINKSRFKIKINDIKNARGDITSSQLLAVFDRDDMAKVLLWENAVKGDVAGLATILRQAMSNGMPELYG